MNNKQLRLAVKMDKTLDKIVPSKTITSKKQFYKWLRETDD